MSYKQASSSVALLFLVLFIVLIFWPDIVYWLFQVEGNETADFLAKRAGMLFLGLSILCFHSRNTVSGEVVDLVALCVGLAMATMALLGVIELMRGNAGWGILVAVFIEVSIAALFYRLWFKNLTAQ